MNTTMSEAQQAKFRAALAVFDVSKMPWDPTFTFGLCDRTGRPAVSCGLHAPDSRVHGGIPVKTKLNAGGIGWPAHTFVFETDDLDEHAIHMGARAALHAAVAHETDESVFVRGEHLVNPHPEAKVA